MFDVLEISVQIFKYFDAAGLPLIECILKYIRHVGQLPVRDGQGATATLPQYLKLLI